MANSESMLAKVWFYELLFVFFLHDQTWFLLYFLFVISDFDYILRLFLRFLSQIKQKTIIMHGHRRGGEGKPFFVFLLLIICFRLVDFTIDQVIKFFRCSFRLWIFSIVVEDKQGHIHQAGFRHQVPKLYSTHEYEHILQISCMVYPYCCWFLSWLKFPRGSEMKQ